MPKISFLILISSLLCATIAEPQDSVATSDTVIDSTSQDALMEMEDVESDDETAEGKLEKMPELIDFVEAEYPQECIRKGVEGSVLLELLINESGTVDSGTIVRRSADPLLDSSALKAALEFRFTPAIADGDSVAVMLQYEYRFNLKEVLRTPDKYINFSGKVLERGTRKPLADAMVILRFIDTLSDTTLNMPFSLYLEQIGKMEDQSLEEDRLVVLTDSNGFFSFQSLPSCSLEVKLSVSGYENYLTREKISKGEELKASYYVRKNNYSDFEITVYGKVEEKEVSRHELSVMEVQKIPGLGGDAVKVVQALPGVGRPSILGSEIVVRGAPSWDSKFFLDGVSIPILYHFGGLKSVYPSEGLEAVDFYPGGFSTRYGGAVAGVIEMRGRAPKTDRVQGNFDFNSIDGAVFMEGPINEKTSILISGRRNFIGDILSYYFDHADPSTYQAAVAPFYWDYLLRTDVNVNKSNDLFFTLFGARDSMGVFFPDFRGGSEEVSEQTENFTMKTMFHMLSAGLESRISDRFQNSLRLSGTYGSDRFSVFGMMKIEEHSYMSYIRDQLSYKASDRITVNAGLDIDLLNHSMVLIMPSAKNEFKRDTTNGWVFGVVGTYLNMEWNPIEKLQLIPGVRYDYFPELDYSGSLFPEFWPYASFNNRKGYSGEPSLRLNARYKHDERNTFKGAAGTYSQTPQPMGQVIHPTWGEPDMPATKASQCVAGYEHKFTDLISLDLQTYFNKQWDIPRMASGADFNPDLDHQRKWYSDQIGRMYGLELMLRRARTDRFFGWIAYTLSRSERWDKAKHKYVIYDQDETHNLQLLGSWHLNGEWDLGVRTRYVTGKPTTPIIGFEYIEDGHYYKPLYENVNSGRLDPFFQVDVRIDKKWVFKKWMFSTYLDLQNISWVFYKSPEFQIYNYNYTDKSVFSMIPMLSFGCKTEF